MISTFAEKGQDITYDSQGKINIGEKSGVIHFDINLKPVLNMNDGFPEIFDP